MGDLKFSQIEVRSVADAVAAQIEEMILTRRLKPGDKLPTEMSLAKSMSVGRPTIREALGSLQATGLLKRKKGGTFVRAIDHRILEEPLNWLLALKPGSVHELFECRRILEASATELAAERASLEDLEKLEICIERMSAAQADRKEFVQANFSFHHRVVAASGNKILLTLYEGLSRSIQSVQMQLSVVPGGMDSSLLEHKQILEMLRDRDSASASQAMLKHLLNTEALSGESVFEVSKDADNTESRNNW